MFERYPHYFSLLESYEPIVAAALFITLSAVIAGAVNIGMGEKSGAKATAAMPLTIKYVPGRGPAE
jgi:hypothetical protein